MNDTLMYFIKVNIAITLFYLFYRLFFAGDTFWKTRRYCLLFSVLISFAYPLLSIESWLEKQESVKEIVVNYALLPEITVNPSHQTNWFNLETVLLIIYVLVVFVLLIRMLVQLTSILRFVLQGKRQVVQGVSIIAIEKEITPFSFFSSVFMNPALHNEHETREILAHELTHVRQGHSFDVLLSEMLSILFWFNPMTWLLKREIRQNLEFLADDKVIESGFDSKAYQYHLLQLSYQSPEVKLGNKFNVSPLKKRIIMMNQQRTSKAGLLKYSLIVPLALALVLSSNAQTVVNKMKKVVTTTAQKSTETVADTTVREIKRGDKVLYVAPAIKKAETQKPPVKTTFKFTAPVIKKDEVQPDGKVYEVVEKMPRYPGGESELLKYIAQNLKYPVIAQQGGAQGLVLVRFIVNKEGEVTNASILKTNLDKIPNTKGVVAVGYSHKDSISAQPNENAKIALEKESLRVINAMQKWTPGEQKGQKVSVYYTLPIKFKLE
jgi:Antirepressor regulating drug resistance, predicted signal transduction N-terminal membrane component